MHNNVQISGKWSKSKPKVDVQYNGRLFLKNGSSYISAVNSDMSTKLGLLIDFDVLKAAISTNAKPEIVFSGRGRHLDKTIWRHISAMAVPIWTKFGRLMQNKMQITEKWSRSEPKVEFQYRGRLFFQTRSRYISAINWYMSTIDVDEIWFVDRFWPSEVKDINKYKIGSSIERPQPPSWKNRYDVIFPQ